MTRQNRVPSRKRLLAHTRRRIVDAFLGPNQWTITAKSNGPLIIEPPPRYTDRSARLTPNERSELEQRLRAHHEKISQIPPSPKRKRAKTHRLIRRLGQRHGSPLNRTPIQKMHGEQNEAQLRQHADERMYSLKLNSLPMALSHIVVHSSAAKRKGQMVFVRDFEPYPILQYPVYFHAGALVADARIPAGYRNVLVDRLIRERLLRQSGKTASKAHEIALQKEQLELQKKGQWKPFLAFLEKTYPRLYKEHQRLHASDWMQTQFAKREHQLSENAARRWRKMHPGTHVPTADERRILARAFEEHQRQTEKRKRNDPVIKKIKPFLEKPAPAPKKTPSSPPPGPLFHVIDSLSGKKRKKT